MARLREAGYNAGICKSKWEGSGGLTRAANEYIDVAAQDQAAAATTTRRYIARPGLRAAVRDREVDGGVRGARRAASGRGWEGLSVPPVRKRRYMMAKWFGPYRRTVTTACRARPALRLTAVREVQ
ncbi:uncharacterized protein LOC109823581 [Asparagus officinalis]|uniref:uncharacterized protein LOC109823581 n=1 Tax=Asparagus officinalis TaxID=4686 RepID=UPI00098E1BB7|nr:uncharacterized protein LOC109823581 [Asparagus officinalis]